MTDQNLVSFIKESLKKGITKSEINNTLLAKGWKKEKISEAFNVTDIKAPSVINRGVKYYKRLLFIFPGIIFLLGFILIGISFLKPQKIEPNWKVYVYDHDTNQPIIGAKVTLWTYHGGWTGCAMSAWPETDQTGYVYFGGWAPSGVCNITIYKDGYINNGISDEQLATLNTGKVHTVHLKLQKIE
jgi:hypothetical protein